MISLVKMRELEIDDEYSLRGPTLQKAIEVCRCLVTASVTRVARRDKHGVALTGRNTTGPPWNYN